MYEITEEARVGEGTTNSGRTLMAGGKDLTVKAKDLAGNYLTLYNNDGGSSLGTSTTTDALGRVDGIGNGVWIHAPDYNLEYWNGGVLSYTQKIRNSRPGDFHVNSYGATPYLTTGAVGTTTSEAAIQAAYAAADSSHSWGARVVCDSAIYLIGASIVPVDNVPLIGQGRLATRFYLKPSVNVPMIDGATTVANGRYDIKGIGFRAQDAATHTGIFPLVKLAPYLSILEDLYFDVLPGDGLELTTSSISGGSDRVTLNDIVISGGSLSRYGIYFNDAPFFRVRGGSAENCDVGIYYKRQITGTQANAISNGQISGYAFEENRRYSYYSEGGSGVTLTDNYVFNAPIGLDELSNNNVVQHNALNNAKVYDGGRGNIISPNHGEPRTPQDGQPFSVFFPSSRANDPDFARRTSTFWTAVGGGSFSRTDTADLGPRMRDRLGRLPLKITGAANKGAYMPITSVVAGETYLVEVFWFGGSSGTADRAQVQIIDNSSLVVLYDSGTLTRNNTTTEWSDVAHRTVFQVPAGTTAVRVQVTDHDANSLFISGLNFIKLALTNGGFEGTYAAGIAPDWTLQAGSTGTPTEETVIVKSGTKAQRLSVTAGQKATIGQVVAPDNDSFYLTKCGVYVVSGSPGRALVGYGNADLNTNTDYQSAVSARFTGRWETVSQVLRPSSHSRILFGLTSHASETAAAVFDDFVFLPLKNAFEVRTAVSAEFTLSAAGSRVAVIAPHIDCRLRRILVVYTTATSADAGTAIRVGTAASSTYYGSLTSEINKAIGDQTEIAPSQTDIRAGRPVFVENAGAKVGTGKYVVVLEYE